MRILVNNFEKLIEKYPFLSLVEYGKQEYICIIQNTDQNITSIYDIDKLTTDEERKEFLSLGDQWWWESNRMIPINIFLKQDWDKFAYTMISFNNKDVTIVRGHRVCLGELNQKRVKRRTVQLVKKVKD